MARPSSPTPDTRLGPDDRDALRTLSPLRVSLERIITQRVTALSAPHDVTPQLIEAEVELVWTLVLEAFRRGVRAVHQGLHRAEGVDHQMIDQALEYAMAAELEAKKDKKP